MRNKLFPLLTILVTVVSLIVGCQSAAKKQNQRPWRSTRGTPRPTTIGELSITSRKNMTNLGEMLKRHRS